MTPKGKVYIEEQKQSAQTKLEARRVFLKEKGMNEDSIRKDATVRKLKAWVRKADFRLSSIAAEEKQKQDLAKAKAEKQAAKAEKKAAGKQPKKAAKEAPPEKKEKKAKKEKPEKQAKAKEKKGGSEEKSPEEQAAAQ
ncbi:MAG: hypothetical protein CVU57_17605 [Deltaproteobacteria bacterium HGW-Deltaproteobacteria-15]|jgi:hypothetical protein|nr:MAG: hypothetical protein CVU57_17605 [Deltaproteobacteria bacterium HGW-Deltaproteobacteria-15]